MVGTGRTGGVADGLVEELTDGTGGTSRSVGAGGAAVAGQTVPGGCVGKGVGSVGAGR